METVLITGCSSGIGAATARAFLEEDWTVYATARDKGDIADLADAGCETAALDVTDGGQVRDVVDRVTTETGRIDCLVNNAGYPQYGAIEDVPLRDLHRQFDVNVYGPYRLIQAVLPHMREQEDGTIVNVSSIAGRTSHPLGGVYCSSKFAIEAMSDALRVEVASVGVDVVLIEPGSVETEFTDRVDEEIPGEADRTSVYDRLYRAFDDAAVVIGGGPIANQPEDVAGTILNAASCTNPAARYSVGTFARLVLLMRFLPDRVRDAGYRIAARLVGR